MPLPGNGVKKDKTRLMILVVLTIFAFGAVIGSFLNVCIYRIPRGETIVTTPSHCMSCGYHLKWYDLIPIVSWLCLGGKCRQCKEKISVQYPIVEALNGLVYVLIFAVNDYVLIDSVLLCLMASALLVLSVIDFRTMEIPLGINAFILVLGVLRVITDVSHWYEYLIGAVLVSGILELIVVLSHGKAMGGGDVKLMAVAGLFLGWQGILLAFMLGCIIGAICHVIRMKFFGAGKVLAFGPYLSIGIFIAMLWGKTMIQIYMGILLGTYMFFG